MDGLETVLVGVLSRIADGSLGEAGSRLWGSLTTLIRRLGPRGSADELPAAEVDQPSAEEVPAIAQFLLRHVHESTQFERELRGWVEHAQVAVRQSNVSNSVSGTVHG